MAVRLEGRQELLEGRLDLLAPATALVQRRVRGDAVHPAPKGGSPFERCALARQREKHVLQNLLGVGLIPRDAERQPVDHRAIALRERLEGTQLAAAQRGEEIEIRGGRVDRLAHRQPLSCSATNGEQLTSATARALSRCRNSTPSRSTNETPPRSTLSVPPTLRIRSQDRLSSSTHGPTTRPASSSVVVPSFWSRSSILSTCLDMSKLRARRLGSRCWSGKSLRFRYLQRCERKKESRRATKIR